MKWLRWEPQNFAESPKPETAKPSKPGFVGSDGSYLGESQKIAGGIVGFEGTDIGAAKDLSPSDALTLVNASGVRMTTHQGERVIAVPAAQDTALLRQALRVLGYAGCRLFHLNTALYKGKGSDAIAQAIEEDH
jgi:hypothetical protein